MKRDGGAETGNTGKARRKWKIEVEYADVPENLMLLDTYEDKVNRYEAELEELNQLMKKRDELRNKELLQAIEQSKRSFVEIMDFLSTDDSQD